MLEDEQKAIAAAARPLLLSPSLHVSTTSNQGDSGTEAGDEFSYVHKTSIQPRTMRCTSKVNLRV
jgi:hypothetical protein